MAPFWLVPVGLILCRLGFAMQLYRDWRRHGLTYVAWPTLTGLTIGSALVGYWATANGHPITAVACFLPGLVDAWISWLKFRDWFASHVRRRR